MPSLTRAAISLRAQTLTRRKVLQRSIRAFSSSQSCSAFFPPPFRSTDSTELDDLLATIRQKVLLPRHLKGDTRKLVSNPKRNEQLVLEDIRVQLGAEEDRLLPHDYAKDGVSFHQTFKRVLKLSTDTKNFSFWMDLLKGYDGAQLVLEKKKLEMIARKMCRTGNITTLLALLNSAKRSGYIAPALIITYVPHAIRLQAITTDSIASASDALSQVDVNVRKEYIKSVMEGESTDDMLGTVPGLAQARAEALQRGLRSVIRFNLVLSRQHLQQALQQFNADCLGENLANASEVKTEKSAVSQRQVETLNDPILAAVPLELQSRLETLLTIAPDAVTSPNNAASEDQKDIKAVPSSTSAADYAKRLLSTFEAQPISTIPTTIAASEPTWSSSQRALLIQRQSIWLLRALAVAASLRAAANASTVVKDKALHSNVLRQQSQVDKALAEAFEQVEWKDVPELRQAHKQYQRYKAGKEWGLFGEHFYPEV